MAFFLPIILPRRDLLVIDLTSNFSLGNRVQSRVFEIAFLFIIVYMLLFLISFCNFVNLILNFKSKIRIPGIITIESII